MSQTIQCPQCHSESIVLLPKKKQNFCEDCQTFFYPPEEGKKILRVFVSYGHDDYADFANKLKEELKKRGHQVFYDKDDLKKGENWDNTLEDGIEWAAVDKEVGRIVFIMTPYSVRRPGGFCLNEIAKALDCGLNIIPIMLIWTAPPLSIYRLQWLDSQRSWSRGHLNEEYIQMDFDRICQTLEENTLDKEGVMYGLLNQLNPLDFNADLVFNQTWFTGRQWVFDYITEWLANTNASRLLCITGKPGIGKTAIATHLLQKFPNIAAYHLCRRNNNAKASPFRAICTIAYHLASQLPTYKEMLLGINIRQEIEQCNDTALFDRLIVQPLSHVQPSLQQKPLIILIDGLDEASVNRKNAIANFIASEFDKLPDWLRIIVTSRPNEEVMTPLQSFHPWMLKSGSDSNQQDIDDYLNLRLATFSTNSSFDKVKEVIKKNAEGIFLYVSMLCDEIIRGHLSFEQPARFPENMAKYYYCSFDERFKEIETYRTHIRPALQLITAACEPLTKEEIAAFLNWDIDRVNDWLISMGSFLLVNDNGRIAPFHASLYDWLGNKTESGTSFFYADKGVGHRLICQADRSHKHIQRYLLKYLPTHQVMCCNREDFLRLFTESEFVEARKKCFQRFAFIKIYMDDLELFSGTFGSAALHPLYDSSSFRQIVVEYGTYMFDKEYYKWLKGLGFSEYLSETDLDSLPESFRFSLISYYYIIRRIDLAIEFDSRYFELPNMEAKSPSELLNYASAFNIMGVCCRIAGKFELAYTYISQSVHLYHLQQKQVSESIVLANLARVYEMDLDFRRCEEILLQGVSLIEQLHYASDSHSDSLKRHAHNGSTYILAEYYLNTSAPNKALPYLNTIGTLYPTPECYDRYWHRYLYSMALYHLQKGDIEEAHDFLCRAEEAAPGDDKTQVQRAIWQWVKGVKSNDQSLLNTAKSSCETVLKSFAKNYSLENYAEALALYRRVCLSLGIDTAVDDTIDVNRFDRWIGYKEEWLEKLLG